MQIVTLDHFPTKEAARSRLAKLALEDEALSFLKTAEDEQNIKLLLKQNIVGLFEKIFTSHLAPGS